MEGSEDEKINFSSPLLLLLVFNSALSLNIVSVCPIIIVFAIRDLY